jgi:hypothetical protein
MTELISLLNDLKTLEAIAKASGAVPVEVTTAIDKILDVLSDTKFVSPDSKVNALKDVFTLISAVDKLEADPAVKEFAMQVVQLVTNIQAAMKTSAAPAAVQPTVDQAHKL